MAATVVHVEFGYSQLAGIKAVELPLDKVFMIQAGTKRQPLQAAQVARPPLVCMRRPRTFVPLCLWISAASGDNRSDAVDQLVESVPRFVYEDF